MKPPKLFLCDECVNIAETSKLAVIIQNPGDPPERHILKCELHNQRSLPTNVLTGLAWAQLQNQLEGIGYVH